MMNDVIAQGYEFQALPGPRLGFTPRLPDKNTLTALQPFICEIWLRTALSVPRVAFSPPVVLAGFLTHCQWHCDNCRRTSKNETAFRWERRRDALAQLLRGEQLDCDVLHELVGYCRRQQQRSRSSPKWQNWSKAIEDVMHAVEGKGLSAAQARVAGSSSASPSASASAASQRTKTRTALQSGSESVGSIDNVVMPFGKYKDESVSAIPISYLFWLLRECSNLAPWLRAAVAGEVDRRATISR